MQPYLICLDLDGTLLNDEKIITHYTKKVLTVLHTVQVKYITMN